jgi:hypothetical protein
VHSVADPIAVSAAWLTPAKGRKSRSIVVAHVLNCKEIGGAIRHPRRSKHDETPLCVRELADADGHEKHEKRRKMDFDSFAQNSRGGTLIIANLR